MKTVHIRGMMCPHCLARVKKALAKLDPAVEVSLETNSARISDAIADSDLKAAIVAAGYEVTGIE